MHSSDCCRHRFTLCRQVQAATGSGHEGDRQPVCQKDTKVMDDARDEAHGLNVCFGFSCMSECCSFRGGWCCRHPSATHPTLLPCPKDSSACSRLSSNTSSQSTHCLLFRFCFCFVAPPDLGQVEDQAGCGCNDCPQEVPNRRQEVNVFGCSPAACVVCTRYHLTTYRAAPSILRNRQLSG